VIVYREAEEEADAGAELAACAAKASALVAAGRPDHDEVTDLLIDLGMIEAAIADTLFPTADRITPASTALRRASLAAGRLFRLSCRGASRAALQATAEAVVAELRALPTFPGKVQLRVPEGYAYYALHPETYLAAAEQLMAEVCPDQVVCVGLRSIGTSLSAVVAAAVEAAGARLRSLTLRPRGHPFDRRPQLTPELASTCSDHCWYFIIDEGPGLSASSFCGTAALLGDLGIPDSRIVFFPSHLPDPAGFRSEAARERWPRHRKAHVAYRSPFPPDSSDLAGGAWRSFLNLPESRWPAVQPQHERRKYLVDGSVLHKFSGLGRYGSRTCQRAKALADAGYTPPVLGLQNGYLAQPFIGGRPLEVEEVAADFLSWAAAYFHHLNSSFASGIATNLEPLLAMIRINVAESLGHHWLGGLAHLERQSKQFGQVPAVAADGRVLPHEWLRTEAGWLKTDALDHHADHFYPGLTDIAWDVAGFGAEFGIPDKALEDWASSLGDRGLPIRLPFYRVAYLAFRLGYTTLAAETLGSAPDGLRMSRLANRYRSALERALPKP
jgi:hypothetical protein